MVVMAEFTSAQPGEIGFRAVGAGAVHAVALLMVDPLHGEAGVQLVPGGALVGMNRGALGNPMADCRRGGPFSREHVREQLIALLRFLGPLTGGASCEERAFGTTSMRAF
jgi:hypothetical protein